MASYYLFLDFETEGLNIPEDRLLEAGWVLTGSDLERIGWGHALFKVSGGPRCNSFVTEMHTTSGLLANLTDPDTVKLEVWEVERSILFMVDEVTEPDDTVRIAGSGVDFDKRQIRHWMPNLDARLHYQLMDTSQIRRFLRDVCDIELEGELADADKQDGEDPRRPLVQHRAYDDAEMARLELIRYRDFLESDILQ